MLTHNGVQQSVSAFTGAYTNSALYFMETGGLADFAFQVCMIASFYVGAR
jgi:hypothetical protein